jgi:hypothetical protein
MIDFASTSIDVSDHFDYRFELITDLADPDVVLLTYLMEDDSYDYSHEEMVLSALRAYWMPIAYEYHRTHFNHPIRATQLRAMARNAIHHLRERAEMLNQLFSANLDQAPIPAFDRADRLYLLSPRPAVGREPNSQN